MFYVIAMGRNLLRVFYLLSVNLAVALTQKEKYFKQFEIKHIRDRKFAHFSQKINLLFVILLFKL